MSGLRFQVFDPTNQTFLGELAAPSQGQFLDEYNSPGYGTVRVLLDHPDAGLLVRDNVVRVVYEGGVRYSWFVETLDRTLSDQTGQRFLVASGVGVARGRGGVPAGRVAGDFIGGQAVQLCGGGWAVEELGHVVDSAGCSMAERYDSASGFAYGLA
jgi:hypothetical protein